MLTISEHAGDLPPVWNSIAGDAGLGLDARYLRAAEPCDVEATRRYLVYETGSGEAVIAVAELLGPQATRNPVASILFGRLEARLPGARSWQLPMLVLCSEFAGSVPYAVRCPTPRDRASLLRAMIAELDAEASRQGWSLAVVDVPSRDVDMTSVLAEQGYLRTVARPFASLRLEWDSWESYLQVAARCSQNAVQNIRKEVNRARRDKLAIVEWSPAQAPESEIHRLMAEHEQRLNRRAWRYQPGLIGRLSEALGADLKVLLAMNESGLQGTAVFAVSGRRGYLKHAGLVAKEDRASAAYFNLIFYHPIRLAIALGLESIEYGNGVFEAKIRRGCTVRANELFFRPRHPAMRSLLHGPVALHRRALQFKYASILKAEPFSFLGRKPHARTSH